MSRHITRKFDTRDTHPGYKLDTATCPAAREDMIPALAELLVCAATKSGYPNDLVAVIPGEDGRDP